MKEIGAMFSQLKGGFFLRANLPGHVPQAESLNRALALSTMAHFLAISG
ncbi:hypothetical protein [Vibrio vulnificus YJ016]|uniref:Uncharacterized protein n=1 Tax=Vibrio vulnificus (strain YJ016) TaxID=196600 RepID=Q7MC35_VIBVY|nr:hypothetical protein [Vibrio vulnificus]BAC97578.1 hypothetical protein [Vibrio vulnificus YJ016]